MYVLSIGALCVATLVLIIVKSRSLGLGLGLVIGLLTFVPLKSDLTNTQLSIAMALVCLVLLGLILRNRVSPRFRTRQWVAAILFAQLPLSAWASGENATLPLIFSVVLILIVLSASALGSTQFVTLGSVLLFFLALHAVLATTEILGLPSALPMADGSRNIFERTNAILPNVLGRPITTFGHPIPLATFALIVAIVCAFRSGLHRVRFALSSSLAVYVILIAGSRSALIALALSAMVGMAFSSRVQGTARFALSLLLIGLTVVALNSDALLATIGLGAGVEATASYLHRNQVLGSFPGLFMNDIQHVLLGWGTNRDFIFDNRIVSGYLQNVRFFDNQFVASTAMYGVLGFALLVMVLLTAVFSRHVIVQSLAVAYIVMAFSFDFLQFSAAAAGFALLAGVFPVNSLLGESNARAPLSERSEATLERQSSQR